MTSSSSTLSNTLSSVADMLASAPLWTWLPALLLMFALTILVYLAYSGLFRDIVVSAREPDHGDLVVAYKTGRGEYKGAGALFTETYSLLPQRTCLGIYYDDPDSVAPPDLRYAVGCILSDGEDDRPDGDEMEAMVRNGYRVAHLPKPNYAVICNFPFNTTASIYVAISRVYPKLKEFISSRGLCAYPAVEIYKGSEIQFMMPLSRQEEWFVSEFAEEDASIATSVASERDPHAPKKVSSSSRKAEEDEDVFAKPKEPVKKAKKVSSSSAGNRASVEKTAPMSDEATVQEEEEGSNESSEFEDLSKELKEDGGGDDDDQD